MGDMGGCRAGGGFTSETNRLKRKFPYAEPHFRLKYLA